jgi:hypothetical protein
MNDDTNQREVGPLQAVALGPSEAVALSQARVSNVCVWKGGSVTSAEPRSGFVGRGWELGCASEALDAIEGGSARGLAVVGEPGIGKTRLLTEVTALAERRDQIVFSGRAAEFERDLPFGVFVDALDDHLRALDPHKIARLDPQLRGELAQVFPALSELATSSASVLQDERYRAHRAVRELLERLAAVRPLVVMLDDLHWADPASIELLSALLRRPPNAGVLLMVSLRPRQAETRLASVLEYASREGLLDRLELFPLNHEEAEQLLSPALTPSLRASLYAQAGGNPFYLEELARSLRRAAPVTVSPGRTPSPSAESTGQQLASTATRLRSRRRTQSAPGFGRSDAQLAAVFPCRGLR